VNRLAFTNHTTCNYFVKVFRSEIREKSGDERKCHATVSSSNKITEIPDPEMADSELDSRHSSGGQKRLSAGTHPKSTSKYIDKTDWNLVFV